MSHPDPELLALVALGEAADAETEDHLGACEECSVELSGLRRTVRAARFADGPLELATPPTAVWDRIAAQAGIAADPRPGEATAPAPRPRPVPSPVPTPVADHDVEASPRRRPRLAGLPLLAAAAVGIVVGVIGSAVVNDMLTPDQPAVAAVATARLQPLPNQETRGSATVVRSDGTRRLDVTVEHAAGASGTGFREVWLLDTETGRLVSLGVLAGDKASFALPADLDLRDFPTVDISAEPFDGNPAHSGDSLARGDLRF